MEDRLPDDENAPLLPASWRRRLHPRRGGAPLPRPKIKPAAAAAMAARIEDGRPLCELAFAAAESDPALADAGRRFLDGEADPLGAAVVGATALPELSHGVLGEKDACALFDAWTAGHGLGFAARVFAEMSELAVRWAAGHGVRRPAWITGRNDPWPWPMAGIAHAAGRRLRIMLAAAGEEEYAAAEEALAGARRTDRQRLVASYLVPTRRDWAAEVCSEAPSSREFEYGWMLPCALSAEHLGLVRFQDDWPARLDVIATLVDGAGAAIAPFVAESGGEAALDVLALLPGDEAFGHLLERREREGGLRALTAAMGRFPRRALRLLAESGSAEDARLLAVHVRARPALAAEPLPAEARRAIEEEARALVPEAAPDELPRILADPPWARAVPAAAPATVPGLEPVGEPLAVDPVDVLPAKMPAPVDPLTPHLLPQVLLRGRDRALPAAAVGHLLTMMAMSSPGERYAGVDPVVESCDPESLARFGLAVFERWLADGTPAAAAWSLTQLGWTGDDAAVRRLSPLVGAWSRAAAHARAAAALDVLASIGTELALAHLHGIAERTQYRKIRERARELIGRVAAGLELTPEQLADRLVPDFGLDAAGGLTLDYGPRRFTVGFDEFLRPRVADEDGTPRKDLPRPGARDDRDRAAAAYRRFADLKKDVRAVAAAQLARLEAAMLDGRRWTAPEFREHLACHPLVRHIARRLVWTSGATSFRIAEDGTLADIADDAFALPPDARVRIAHPVLLGDEVAEWTRTFADYEILQPFPQLGRPVHALTAAERGSGRLERFEGVTVPPGAVLGLARRGWDRAAAGETGLEPYIRRTLPGSGRITVDLDPGLLSVTPGRSPGQRIARVRAVLPPAPDPVQVSEALADLAALAETPGPI
ncbi:DUF4132 domain-containing protein [Spirillospora sp. NPDC029432]|uniref:DUF4132 domain-containing protein n=1 Tax=Spirillospora sp. NPDC029432 TaxID=3154599 RepID=UPI003455A73D